MNQFETLSSLGWRPLLQQQLNLDQLETCCPARIVEHARSGYTALTETGELHLQILSSMPRMVVGDWILLDRSDLTFSNRLEPFSVIKRKAAGSKLDTQLIASNIDTLFVVSSLNEDLNLNRIERYLVLANQVNITPVIVLTKADLCASPEVAVDSLRKRNPELDCIALNALDKHQAKPLEIYCKNGQTVALVGSSGTGKSTLTNTLLGENLQLTGGIREADSKGRHTTTSRSLMKIPWGGWVLDTPGMRELQLVDSGQGILSTFQDIEDLAKHCKFSDCQHLSEPGCEVLKQIQLGNLKQERLDNYQKLLREDARHSQSLADTRAKSKAFGRMAKRVAEIKNKNKLLE